MFNFFKFQVYFCSYCKNLKTKYETVDTIDSDRLMKQIVIFESHSHDNFEEMDTQLENIEGTWDGKKNYFNFILVF